MRIRLQELDVFRGVAALLVVLFHYTTRYDAKYGHAEKLLYELPLGYIGVHFFFIISGFVIFMTMQNTRKPLDFIVSRAARLYPAYWLAIILTSTAMLSYGLPDKTITLSQILVNFTMLQEFIGVNSVDGVYWTLTRELIFYTSILIIFVMGQLKNIIPVVTIWLFLQFSSGIIENIYGYFPWKITLSLNLQYANLFSAGIIFYLLKNGHESKFLHFLILVCITNQYIREGMETTVPVAFAYTLFYLFAYDKLKFICVKPLIYLGSISYSLYLIHENIGFMLITYLSKHGFHTSTAIFIAIFVALTMASLMTYLVEKPSNAWLRAKYKNSRFY